MISIIVPVYNTEKTLRRCVDSILAQTYTDFELLLINDGSKDASGNICDEYAMEDSRVRVFHKPNGGVSSARNLGLDNATGEWITFCDSDDYTFPNWLSNFNVEGNAKYDLICQGFESDKPLFVDNIKNKPYIHTTHYEGNIKEGMYILQQKFQIGFLWIKAFKSVLIEQHKIRFDETCDHAEDDMFIFQYLCYCKNILSKDDVGYYYFVPNWELKYKRTIEQDIYIYEKLYDYTCQICHKRDNSKIERHYREELTSRYLKSVLEHKLRQDKCIRGLRRIVKNDFKYSQIFWLTKIILLADTTYKLSIIAILLQKMIKELYSKIISK